MVFSASGKMITVDGQPLETSGRMFWPGHKSGQTIWQSGGLPTSGNCCAVNFLRNFHNLFLKWVVVSVSNGNIFRLLYLLLNSPCSEKPQT